MTNQVKEQGGTLGRMVSLLADWGWSVPGCSIDRMCAGGLTAVHFGASVIASGMADAMVCGGVEHMGHLPMGVFRDLHPRTVEVLGDDSALTMGLTAENLHDQWPELTRERADRYAYRSQEKAARAVEAGKMRDMIVALEVELPNGSRAVVDRDQTPRPTTTLEGLAQLQPVFRPDGRVTAGNACPLTDGAAGLVLMSRPKAEALGLQPRMRWVATGVAAVDPRIMGTAPVPATRKALERAGLSLDQMDIIEINEAFAVQVLYFLDHMGLDQEDPRVNIWGGAIAYGHPLAASGPRLVAFLQRLFEESPNARYGLTTMCVGRGQGVSIIWENLARA